VGGVIQKACLNKLLLAISLTEQQFLLCVVSAILLASRLFMSMRPTP